MENYEPIDSRYLHPRDTGNGIFPAERTLKIFQWFIDHGWNEIAAASIAIADYETIVSRMETQLGERIVTLDYFLKQYTPTKPYPEIQERYDELHRRITAYRRNSRGT